MLSEKNIGEKILLEPRAEKEFSDSFDYYLERSDRAAREFEDEIIDALIFIAEHPQSLPVCYTII
ncbi:MAG: type II toxin-antitoxin system RelE/ParE family toxin [Chitinophagales bacterium]|nr:type II toxin-antitoxin system RelE/ParE family toxin [Chitinophagales bacterium]